MPATRPRIQNLLDYLAASFVESGFDTQQMLRMICNSRTYQLSVETNPLNEDDALNYSHALPRRLPAEVIYDAVHTVTGAISNIPGQPKGTRAAALSDAGVKLADGFLQNFGRPARESACECERSSGLQLGPVMALISGPTIGTAIADPKNELEKIVAENPDDRAMAEEIFLACLGTYAHGKRIGDVRQNGRDDQRGSSSNWSANWKKPKRTGKFAARNWNAAEKKNWRTTKTRSPPERRKSSPNASDWRKSDRIASKRPTKSSNKPRLTRQES